MKLTLKRVALKETYTIGKLYINGKYFCDTLEDAIRDVKIFGETAIDYGVYTVKMTMSNRFKKVMPILLDVPKFEGVRIHSGSTIADTLGCILVGKNTIKGKLTQSREHAKALNELLIKEKSIVIEII